MDEFSGQQGEQSAPFIPAIEHPANQDRRAFQVWSEQYGMWVEDAGLVCAGVHDNGFETADEFAEAMGAEDDEARRQAELAEAWKPGGWGWRS